MSAVVRQLLNRGAVATAIMVDIDHPASEEMLRFWTGMGVIEYGGNTYYGLGTIGQVSPLDGNTEIEVTEVRFQISGVDPDLLEGLSLSVKGRTATVYEAWLDQNYRVAHRDTLMQCRCDYQTYSVDPDSGKASIQIVAHAGLFHLLNRSGAKVSPEEQKAIYPEDTGFDEMHKQQDEQLIWRPA